jgi:hypothetical protein
LLYFAKANHLQRLKLDLNHQSDCINIHQNSGLITQRGLDTNSYLTAEPKLSLIKLSNEVSTAASANQVICIHLSAFQFFQSNIFSILWRE